MSFGGERVYLGNWDGQEIWRPRTAEERLAHEWDKNLREIRKHHDK